MRHEQEPEKHESYGIMSFSRVMGTPRDLFGSSIQHGDTIEMRLSTAEARRDFQKSYYREDKRIITVEMSQAQFAEAITTMNIGDGVPVTIKRLMGKDVSDPPEVNFRKRAQSELKTEMNELGELVEKLSKDAKEILTRKGSPINAGEKDKLLKDLMFLVQEIQSNIPFAHECFVNAVEETVTDAKAEVDACLTSLRDRVGQAALDGKIKVPALNASPLTNQ